MCFKIFQFLHVGDGSYRLTHTCSFDSICQVLVVGMIDKPQFATKIKKYPHIPIFKFVNRVFTERKLSENIYAMQASIMIPYIKKETPKQIYNQIDKGPNKYIAYCDCNIHYLLRHCLQDFKAFNYTKSACANVIQKL